VLQPEVNEGRLVPGVARELARLDTEADMLRLAREAREYGHTSEQMRQIVASHLRQSREGRRPAKPSARPRTLYKLNQWVAEVEPKRVVLRFAARRGTATREERARALRALLERLDGASTTQAELSPQPSHKEEAS
jgi:hypothetical protein